jgi:predicted kinase
MSLDIKHRFIHWYFDEFKTDSLYIAMDNKAENSPWHRERSIGVHTDMVVTNYLTSEKFSIIGAMACAFHDVGKPEACVVKHSEARGSYNSFGGHELISARYWEDYAVRNWKRLVEIFELNVTDIYAIGYAIEHHLPYDIKKEYKRDVIGKTLVELNIPLRDILLADTYGRISDDQEEKLQRNLDWLDTFNAEAIESNKDWKLMKDLHGYNGDGSPVVYFPIGASGTGKSTFRTKLDADTVMHCWDDYRMEWYDTSDYAEAFRLSCNDKGYGNKTTKQFHADIETGRDVYVDNTNISAKRRRGFITHARSKGYKVVAVLFPVALQDVIDRQDSRFDKTVPEDAVRRQYMGLQAPSYGEFDHVIVKESNLKRYL